MVFGVEMDGKAHFLVGDSDRRIDFGFDHRQTRRLRRRLTQTESWTKGKQEVEDERSHVGDEN
jgi:hypothetical protein